MTWLSLPEYARLTGTPESTVRAMLRDGRLRGELCQRGLRDFRTVWMVWVDEPAADQPQDDPQPPADVRVASESSQPPAATTEPPAAMMRAMEILDALIRANGETMERQADMIAALRERAAAAETERDLLRTEVERLRRRWWRFWA